MVVTVGTSHHLGGLLPTFHSCLPLAVISVTSTSSTFTQMQALGGVSEWRGVGGGMIGKSEEESGRGMGGVKEFNNR